MKKFKYVITLVVVLFVGAFESKSQNVITVKLPVSDMERSLKFYQDAFDCEVVSDKIYQGDEIEAIEQIFNCVIREVELKLGESSLTLKQFLSPQGRPIPFDAKSNDVIFQHLAIVVSDMDKAFDKLTKMNAGRISNAPQTLPKWNKAASGISAYYFRDPDNHPLELIYFPKGKGKSNWHAKSKKLFMGIDHTAIAVIDTDTSLKFYEDFIGLNVLGGSFNYGKEQEHLNGVRYSKVRITGLASENVDRHSGVEFLEYLRPEGGMLYPKDTQNNDFWNLQTIIEVPDLEKLYKKAQFKKMNVSEEGIIAFDGQRFLELRDPNGHQVYLVQKK
ncbi:VOC family protein [Aureibacter tunicatorum]|uniref:Catechol 2,3-dioxygenase-like lactoylglutathione lyase family enzyme n=1 Tax=Aureibacter tunicatorum TaxID=866807 RepID=A0AAE4BVA2_9BACT|nr:VOC family protein [Aureibacter tunicatorum]MDR6241558.1 catechol 2,3-dioxygenase-like lactoylglutathione lyase family enzyme [Aureibacter tunicatorum]BDD07218.1 hypothetical protein AUTU_47010 [Aureibacter tunicatorum]